MSDIAYAATAYAREVIAEVCRELETTLTDDRERAVLKRLGCDPDVQRDPRIEVPAYETGSGMISFCCPVCGRRIRLGRWSGTRCCHGSFIWMESFDGQTATLKV